MMTNKTAVNRQGVGRETALNEVERFAARQNLSPKTALRLRLLAEESMGMISEIVGDFDAYFWVEGDSNTMELHMEAYTSMDLDKREQLLSVSSSGRNMAFRGIMGKIRDVFETYLMAYDDLNRYATENGIQLFPYGETDMMTAGMDWTNQCWSLGRYRNAVAQTGMADDSSSQAWDELEKSIVARLADDVQIGIRSDKVEMVIRYIPK